MCGKQIKNSNGEFAISSHIDKASTHEGFIDDPYDDLFCPQDTDGQTLPSADSEALNDPNNPELPVMSPQDLMLRPVYPVDDLRICSECGAIVRPNHAFCGECGAKYIDLAKERRDAAQNKQTAEPTSNACTRSDAQPSEAAFELRLLGDDGAVSEIIPLYEGENIIGHKCSASLAADAFVSPKHLKITCKGKTAVIEDNHSLNGVFIRFRGASVRIHTGDIFRIGEELITYIKGNSKHRIIPHNESGDDAKVAGGPESLGWGYLRVILGAYSEGSVFRLSKDTITIGRTRADILFDRDSFVSGTHAQIQKNKDGVLLTDLDSSNGTFIRFKTPHIVKNDITYILIGNQLLRLTPRTL
jgi:pSer/pThr/pTyr-binding forkhead associated (FHA) protein